MSRKLKISTLASPVINHSAYKRSGTIKKITIHTAHEINDARTLCKKNAANPYHYYIGFDGEIIAGLEEDSMAYVSNNDENDSQAINICLSNSDNNIKWPVSTASIDSLINLCDDICRRYGINLEYTGNTRGTLTCHDMFANVKCPGPYLKNRLRELGFIIYNKSHDLPFKPQQEKGLFRVRKLRDDKKSQRGIFKSYNEAVKMAKELDLNVYDRNGIEVFNSKLTEQMEVWDRFDPIKIGDTVSSIEVACYHAPGSSLCSIKKNGIWKTYIPALGGYIPNQIVSMVNPDDEYTNGLTMFTLDEGIVQDIDEEAGKVLVHGLWVCKGPLVKKRTR